MSGFRFLFGPVPSRRLGMSLGVDLVPHKVCSLNCVYCECGNTTKLTLERMEYVPYAKVTSELEEFFRANPDPDYITFSGAGEPTLNSRFGDVLRFIKALKPEVPVAVLTNGTLLRNPEVRNEMLEADLVLPSLDAATEDAFMKINKPSPHIDLKEYIRGLEDFRHEYKGQIWLEVFILPGYNDDRANLDALREAIIRISPDKIQLNTLDRPGAVENLRPANMAELKEIVRLWSLPGTEIIAPVPGRKKIASYRPDAENAILETISRRPCTLDDISKVVGLHINEVNKYLGVLEHEGKIKTSRQERGLFYSLSDK
ncbi:MAG: radical SAM protein [Bacteroidales bacterium]|nr:radical SAM protein [Bacteroidales bacterium]